MARRRQHPRGVSPAPFSSWRARLLLSVGLVVINLTGVVLVYCLAALVVPLSPIPNDNAVRVQNLVLAGIAGGVGIGYGVILVNHRLGPLARWARTGAPEAVERTEVLHAPITVARRQGLGWMLAAVGFGAFNAQHDLVLGFQVALIIGLSGWSTTVFSYLATERVLRSLSRRALEAGARLPTGRSVVRRAMATWWLGTGVVLLGLAVAGLSAVIVPGARDGLRLAITMIVLGTVGLGVGGLSSYVAAKASADPVRGLRAALGQVERGDLSVAIPIYDATEIGHLQAGFNDMVAGLRDRQRMRDLFGRHVGEEVARKALADGVALGGESREVTVLFVDLVGSTSLAQERPPGDVVRLLNRFFEVVIDVVHEHHGWINKFAGDAALAVWGAPAEVPERATRSLAAARQLGRRLRAEVPELAAGIGVSTGVAVAGNVGAANRYEYTVIGDPVNEAARLTDLSKDLPSRVLARADLVAAADPEEAARWRSLEPVLVRGRSEPTPVATPLLD